MSSQPALRQHVNRETISTPLTFKLKFSVLVLPLLLVLCLQIGQAQTPIASPSASVAVAENASLTLSGDKAGIPRSGERHQSRPSQGTFFLKRFAHGVMRFFGKVGNALKPGEGNHSTQPKTNANQVDVAASEMNPIGPSTATQVEPQRVDRESEASDKLNKKWIAEQLTSPLRISITANQESYIIGNYSTQRVTGYLLGCVMQSGAKLAVTRKAEFRKVDLPPLDLSSNLLYGRALTIYADPDFYPCIKEKTKLAVLEVRFSDGSAWQMKQ